MFNSRGVAYDIKGDTDRAIADFDAAIRLKPEFADAYINRGLAWIEKRDYERAIADFTEATILNTENAFLAFDDRAGAREDRRVARRACRGVDDPRPG